MTNSMRRRRSKNKHKYPHKYKEEIDAATQFDVDKISQLPDDIRISIISRLTVAEAVSTSILSTRWRRLHKYITCLNFSPTSKQFQTKRKDHVVSEKEFLTKYARVIEHSLDTHNVGAILQEFRLYLPWIERDTWLCDNYWPIERQLVGRWLDFAFSKEVQIIHLHMISPYPRISFPLLPSKYVPSFKTLKELSLRAVEVGGEFFGLLLSNFIALERLSVEDGKLLGAVRIFGDVMAPKLTHLNLSCSDDSIEIRDMTNLESLRCTKCDNLVLENVPRLVELDTCVEAGIQALYRSNDVMISKQLVKLTLSSHEMFHGTPDMCLLLKLVSLKHTELECRLYYVCRSNIHHLIRFIEACPCLHKLEIEFDHMDTSARDEKCCIDEDTVKNITTNEHLKLKRVKLSRLYGDPIETEFGSYIVGKATALEELVMEVHPRYSCRKRAHLRNHFQPMLRDSVNFVLG